MQPIHWALVIILIMAAGLVWVALELRRANAAIRWRDNRLDSQKADLDRVRRALSVATQQVDDFAIGAGLTDEERGRIRARIEAGMAATIPPKLKLFVGDQELPIKDFSLFPDPVDTHGEQAISTWGLEPELERPSDYRPWSELTADIKGPIAVGPMGFRIPTPAELEEWQR
jgi:hypothetical protein